MANRKISELQSRTPALSDLMLVGDPSSGYSYKCTVTALATIIETDIADGFVTIGTTQTISGAKTFSNNLTLTSVANATTTQTKFLTLNGSNVVNYRTGAEVLADIGGQGSITLTTLGTGGVATLVGNTLNIPQYQGALTNPVTGTGTTNYVTKWTSLSTIGNSQIIDNGTAVGIGTAASNAYKLSVAGIYRGVGVGNAARIELYDTQSGGATFYISPQESLGVTSLGTYGAFPILFVTNSAERIRISSAGDITISTIANATVDTDKFLVSDSGVIKYRTGAEVLSDIGAASSSSISGTTNYISKFTSSSAIGNSQIFDNGTSVGIGTATPAVTLAVYNATTPKIHLQNSTSGVTDTDGFQLAFSSSDGYIWNYENGGIRFATNNSERMRLDASGNLGINTSSPAAKLDVQGSSSDQIRLRTAATEYYSIGRNASTGFLDFYGSQSGYVGYVWGGVNGERMRLDANGALLVGIISAYGDEIARFYNSSNAGRYVYVENPNTGTSAASFVNVLAGAGADLRLGAYGTNHSTQANNATIFNHKATGSLLFGTVGTERMRLDANGRLGIGVTSPNTLLQVAGSAKLYNPSGNTALTLRNSTTTDANGVTFSISGTTAYYENASGAMEIGPSASDYLAFKTANTERARITSGGNVLVGTTTDGGWKFAVSGNDIAVKGTSVGNTSVRIASSTQTLGTDSYDLISDGSAAYVWNRANLPLVFGTNATERMRITSVGEVLVGSTTSTGMVTNQLQLGNTSSGGSGIQFLSSTTGTGGLYFGDGTTGGDRYRGYIEYAHSVDAFLFSTATTERMRITSGGNVGIGITAPSAKLVVSGTGDLSYIYNSGASTTDANFYIYSATRDILMVRNSGNIGIGTASPSAKLEVAGQLLVSYANPDVDGIKLNATTGTNAASIMITNTGGNFYIGRDKSDGSRITGTAYANAIWAENSYPLVFGVNNSERMRITSSGATLMNTTTTNEGVLQIRYNDSASSPLNWGIRIEAARTNGSVAIAFANPNGLVGSIQTSGTATTYNTTSDYRLKQDLKTFNGLSLIDSINVYDYQWKADSTRSYGVMAHELQSVIPYAVTGVKDGENMQGVDYSKLVPVLIQSIKDLKTELQILKNK